MLTLAVVLPTPHDYSGTVSRRLQYQDLKLGYYRSKKGSLSLRKLVQCMNVHWLSDVTC